VSLLLLPTLHVLIHHNFATNNNFMDLREIGAESEIHHHTSSDCPTCCASCSLKATFLCLVLSIPFLVLALTEPWDNIILLQENSTDIVLNEDYLTDYYEYYTRASCPWGWNALFWFLAFLYPYMKFFIQCACMYSMYRISPTVEGEESYWKSILIDSTHFNVFYLGSLVYKFTQAIAYIGGFLFLGFTVGYHTETPAIISIPTKPGFTYFIGTSQLCLTIVDFFIFLLDLKYAPTNFQHETSQLTSDDNNLRAPLLSDEMSGSSNTNGHITGEESNVENILRPLDGSTTAHMPSSFIKEEHTANSRSEDQGDFEAETQISTNSSLTNEIKKDPLILVGVGAVLCFVLLMIAPLMNISYEGVGASALVNTDEDFTLNQILKRFRDVFKFIDSESSANTAYTFFLIESVIAPAFLLWMAIWANYLLTKGKEKETALLYFMIEYTYPFMSIESFTIALIHFSGTAEPLSDYYFNLSDTCKILDENFDAGCLSIEYTTLWGTWILFLFLLTLLPYVWMINLRLRRIHTPHADIKSKILMSS